MGLGWCEKGLLIGLVLGWIGCEPAAPELEKMRVGVIDPASSIDDEIRELPSETVADFTAEEAEKPRSEGTAVATQEPLPESTTEMEEGTVETASDEAAVPKSAQNDGLDEGEPEPSVSEAEDEGASEPAEMPTETGETEQDLTLSQDESVAKVTFTVDMGCTAVTEAADVFILGMGKWNAEWSIATALQQVGESQVFVGNWEGTPGFHTFKVGYSPVGIDPEKPWSQVEDLSGLPCVGDAYGNRGLELFGGMDLEVTVTYGTCESCTPSCDGFCGGQSGTGDCFCDSLCEEYDDCCADFQDFCGTETCAGACGGKAAVGECYCDAVCEEYDDCCGDYALECK